MKRGKKGISSVLGALIFLQILLVSLLLVIHVINNETKITLKSIQRFQTLSENAPIEEEVENNITYLYSTTPFIITHIIYPDGEIVNTSIVVNNKFPVSQILDGCPWAIVVTNKGTWYNVTLLGNGISNDVFNVITFPNYHDYGMPLNSSILDLFLPGYSLYGAPDLGVFHVPYYSQPNWNIFEGISSASALSLVPVNVTIGDPTTYKWALTNAVLVFYPLSPTGWINITYYLPIYSMYWGGNANVLGITETFATWTEDNGSIGIYIPINVSATFALNPFNAPNTYIKQNATVLEYVYIYNGNGEVTSATIQTSPPTCIGFWCGGGSSKPIGYSWTYTQIGEPWSWYFPDYLISSTPQSVFGIPITNYFIGAGPGKKPGPTSIYLPPVDWFIGYNGWNVTKTQFPISGINNHFINVESYPYLQVYQVDINLHKGEVLDYAYDSYNNTWLLLYNWTFNYNNPAMYIKAYKTLGQNDFPDGMYYNYFGSVFIYNIDNIQYLTNYPVYVVVPKGVYLLQINLS